MARQAEQAAMGELALPQAGLDRDRPPLLMPVALTVGQAVTPRSATSPDIPARCLRCQSADPRDTMVVSAFPCRRGGRRHSEGFKAGPRAKSGRNGRWCWRGRLHRCRPLHLNSRAVDGGLGYWPWRLVDGVQPDGRIRRHSTAGHRLASARKGQPRKDFRLRLRGGAHGSGACLAFCASMTNSSMMLTGSPIFFGERRTSRSKTFSSHSKDQFDQHRGSIWALQCRLRFGFSRRRSRDRSTRNSRMTVGVP